MKRFRNRLYGLLVGGVVLISARANGSGRLFPNGLTPVDTGSALTSASCERCHSSVARDWHASQHSTSANDPIFRHSWESWPKAWCLNCHLPLVQDQIETFGVVPEPALLLPTKPLHGEGVGCLACHVRDGVILTPSRPSLLGQVAHTLREEPLLADSAFCSGCHQFNFQQQHPVHPFSYGDEPLQNTFVEWQSSGAAAEGIRCQDCHMPGGDHTFPGAHDSELLRRSFSLTVRALEKGYEIQISATGIGHNVPTGDPFRRVIVELLEDDEVVYTYGLRRHHRPNGNSFELIADTTLVAPKRGLDSHRSLVVHPDGRPTAWRLWMYFGDRRFEELLEPHQVRTLVATGVIEGEGAR